ncbi:hypothetical protein [Streptomyces californicus]|uniref:hypothetical protein n=1 Tax=Streptomyces californicus TaxID=67351 RepID=UPI0037A49DAB
MVFGGPALPGDGTEGVLERAQVGLQDADTGFGGERAVDLAGGVLGFDLVGLAVLFGVLGKLPLESDVGLVEVADDEFLVPVQVGLQLTDELGEVFAFGGEDDTVPRPVEKVVEVLGLGSHPAPRWR